jgi:hypothetical protein
VFFSLIETSSRPLCPRVAGTGGDRKNRTGSSSARRPEAAPRARFVRYCRFQEERLRVIKQHVQGVQDIRAYNALANDYNSRCADFLHLDEDLKAVMDELNAMQPSLGADAMRILSSWPWRAASGTTEAK